MNYETREDKELRPVYRCQLMLHTPRIILPGNTRFSRHHNNVVLPQIIPAPVLEKFLSAEIQNQFFNHNHPNRHASVSDSNR